MGVVRTVVSGLFFFKKREMDAWRFLHILEVFFTYPLAPISLENHATVVLTTLTAISNLLGPPYHGSGRIEEHNDS